MKYYSVDSASVTLNAVFYTKKGSVPLNINNYTAEAHSVNGSVYLAAVDGVVNPTASANGEVLVSYTFPTIDKGGLVSIELFTGTPRVSIGELQWYLLNATVGEDEDTEYSTSNSTSVAV